MRGAEELQFLFSGCSGRVVIRYNQGNGEARHRQLIFQRLRGCGQPRRCSCALRLVTLRIQSVSLCALKDRYRLGAKKKERVENSMEWILSHGKCGPDRAKQKQNTPNNLGMLYFFFGVFVTKQKPQTPRSVFFVFDNPLHPHRSNRFPLPHQAPVQG